MNIRAAAILAVAAIIGSPAMAQQTPPSTAPAAAGSPAAAGLPTVRHLVYQFGYNTPAASQGKGTGTTTIDIVGLAKDGGMTVTATDDWWNTVNPRQTYTCEVYPTGAVTCPTAPYAISPIQIAVVPLLGQSYFTPLGSNPSATWKQAYNVRATFVPAGSQGFLGQVNTWNGAYNMTGKGTIPNSAPLILIHSDGSMKQQGGRYITVNQKANIAFDPRIQMPVLVDEVFTFVPRMSVSQYTIQMKLIRD